MANLRRVKSRRLLSLTSALSGLYLSHSVICHKTGLFRNQRPLMLEHGLQHGDLACLDSMESCRDDAPMCRCSMYALHNIRQMRHVKR